MPDDPSAQSADPKGIVDRFLSHQRAMYAGGDTEPVAHLLADDVVWHIPGQSPIAGDYRGRDAVIAYFATRRELAGGAIAITEQGDLTGPDVVVQLANGRATLGGELDDSLGASRRLTVAAVDVDYLGQVGADDDMRIGVTFDRITRRSVQVRYDAFVDDRPVARARARYVCLDVGSGAPTPLPDTITSNAANIGGPVDGTIRGTSALT